jgi:hypothetical protein
VLLLSIAESDRLGEDSGGRRSSGYCNSSGNPTDILLVRIILIGLLLLLLVFVGEHTVLAL